LKGLETSDLEEAKRLLKPWIDTKNKRVHGSTHRQVKPVFDSEEKETLLSLPSTDYALFSCERRRVSEYGHVTYQYNYYSVPYALAGQDVYTKSDGRLLRIYANLEQVACHAVCENKGKYITQESHKMAFKQYKSNDYYLNKGLAMGAETYQFMLRLKDKHPRWTRMAAGLIQLATSYDSFIVNAACKRALLYSAISYQSVKQICEKKLYVLDDSPLSALQQASGFSCDLSLYDSLTGAIQ
tara:strand:- start:64 stop:786 length:723 start_codon:yes stop_codon:yes gene_type:complete